MHPPASGSRTLSGVSGARGIYLCRLFRSETGQSGQSPHVTATYEWSQRHASCRAASLRLHDTLRSLSRQSPKNARPPPLLGGGTTPLMPLKNNPRTPLHHPKKNHPLAVGHAKRLQQPVSARGEEVEVLGLDDAARDACHHHLECSGRGGQEEGYHASRHVI